MRKVLMILLFLAAVVVAVVVVRPMAARALAAYPDFDAWVTAAVAVVSEPVRLVGAILLGAATATALAYYRRVRRARAIRR